jgi:cation diffusion facilitator CzcD-associated flavoprotein CzcO
LSFAPNPGFSKLFPDQPEILQYIKNVAKKFDVDTHIKVNISWDGAAWQEDTKTWSVRLSNVQTGEKFVQECNILISGIGGLVNPNPCSIPGADTFKGPIAHTARWRKDIVLEDKNVIVVGNGCSGSQVVPAIASKVKNIYHFFRSSQFYFPRRNPTIHPWVKWAFRHVPFFMVFFRYLLFNFLEFTFIQFHTDDRGDRHRRRAKIISDNYVETRAPKEYWDLLKPTYMVGCKRRVFDPGYLGCLHRDNVHLTNDPITKIEPTEVVTKSGKHYPADVIVRRILNHN